MIDELKPYSDYKDSGLPWLGKVPGHWSIARGGTLFSKADRPVRPGDETVTCFRDGTVTLRKNRRLRGYTEAIYELGYQGIRKGDLIIHAMDAFAGAIGVSDSDGKGSPIYGVCVPKSDANPYFYAHVVREMARTQWILALSRGIRERSTDFRFEGFATQFVPVPPPAEQAAIVRFLGALDRRVNRFVRAKRRLIELLTEQKQAIITHSVTRGLNPNAKLKPSGIDWLGDVPEHWRVERLAKFFTLQRGFDITKEKQTHGGVPVVSSGGVSSYHNCATSHGPGVIVGRKGTAGSVHYVDGQYWAHDTTLWVNDFKGNHPRYVYYVLLALNLKRFDTGSANPTLNRNVIHPEPIAYPASTDEQHAIASSVDRALLRNASTREIVDREIALIREYRTRLVSDVVTGKLDVRAAAERLPAEEAAADETDAGDDVVSPDEADDLVEAGAMTDDVDGE
jgi:type I restriction enzyme S subunit